ncbi:MAG: hypothetical protein EBS49_02405 [Verrucomicrobia bacterium]|nr:hypothetical protein [Verrucomicrobiota bacterium]
MIHAPKLIPEDLSPGDQRSASADLGGIRFHLIESVRDPLFPRAFGSSPSVIRSFPVPLTSSPSCSGHATKWKPAR